MLEVNWKGPYSWPKFESLNGLPAIPKTPGIYIQAVEYNEGYLIFSAGISRRPIPTRFREHSRSYLKGEYNIFDIDLMKQGTRQSIWQGWGWTPEKKIKFERNKEFFQTSVNNQLSNFRIFVADIGSEPRLLERLEFKVMNSLYHSEPPYCEIPDQGMMLRPKRDDERKITVKNNCEKALFGIPITFEI